MNPVPPLNQITDSWIILDLIVIVPKQYTKTATYYIHSIIVITFGLVQKEWIRQKPANLFLKGVKE